MKDKIEVCALNVTFPTSELDLLRYDFGNLSDHVFAVIDNVLAVPHSCTFYLLNDYFSLSSEAEKLRIRLGANNVD